MYLKIIFILSLLFVSCGAFSQGLIIPENWQETAHFEVIRDNEPEVTLPSKFDWRTIEGGLSPVQNQGSCGSCYLFSATATVEDLLWIAGNKKELSQQAVLSCNDSGNGCMGGFFNILDFYLDPGSVTAEQFPYVAKKVKCKEGLEFGEKIKSWSYIGSKNTKPTVEQMKRAIFVHGPISVDVAVDSKFQAYKSGVYSTCNARRLNHMVNLVGWDDEGGYWIMRNSWGASWGEHGFMRIKYGCDKIGDTAAFAILE
jgi:C1A family cysteine protease